MKGYTKVTIEECNECGLFPVTEDAFLSGMIGSAWGTFTVRRDKELNYIVSRNHESEKRVYVDPDRR